MNGMTKISTIFAAMLGCSALVGCNTKTLHPVQAEGTAGESQAGIRLAAYPEPWPSTARTARRAFIVKVRVENNRRAPIRVNYDNMAMIASDGQRLSSISGSEIEALVNRPISTSLPPTAIQSRFGAFIENPPNIQPPYAREYPGFEEDRRLLQLRQNIFPDGLIAPGEQQTGYAFFERDGAGYLTLRVPVEDVKTGEFWLLSAPFVVR